MKPVVSQIVLGPIVETNATTKALMHQDEDKCLAQSKGEGKIMPVKLNLARQSVTCCFGFSESHQEGMPMNRIAPSCLEALRRGWKSQMRQRSL